MKLHCTNCIHYEGCQIPDVDIPDNFYCSNHDKLKTTVIPADATNLSVFAIKDCDKTTSHTGKVAFIGYQRYNGNFEFTQVPYEGHVQDSTRTVRNLGSLIDRMIELCPEGGIIALELDRCKDELQCTAPEQMMVWDAIWGIFKRRFDFHDMPQWQKDILAIFNDTK